MNVLITLTYYRPHKSGLTAYVERLAKGLVGRGHEVTILASKHDNALVELELLHGIRVVRVPVLARVSKGVLMPLFGRQAKALLDGCDLVHVVAPHLDAPRIVLLCRIRRIPVVFTYICDVVLSPGVFNRFAEQFLNLSSYLSALFSSGIVTHTADNAANSLLLRTFHRKVKVIPPPVEVASVLPNEVREFTKRWSLGDRQVIGMASRFAAEKGVEILLGALPIVLEAFPDAVVLFAGEHLDVVGESGYQHKLAPMLRVHPRWIDVGYLTEEELACFYASCSLTVLPSLNTTEAFGMVQVEGMLCGAPAVVSDLPGVRVPVQQTGMGLIVPVGDERALARAIIRVLEDRESFVRPRAVIEAQFSTEATVTAYERLYCAQVLKSSGEPRGRRVCRRR